MTFARAGIVLALVTVGLCACAPRATVRADRVRMHRGPARDERSAALVIRVRHAARVGDLFGDRVEIDGRPALGANDHDGRVRGSARVAPGPHRVRLSTVAFDESTRTAIGYTQVPVRLECARHSGRRQGGARRSCVGEVPVPYLYEAADLEPTVECAVDVPLRADAGGEYVIDYLVRADGSCAARCRRLDGGPARSCE